MAISYSIEREEALSSNVTTLYETLCTIWYYLYNLKNVKNIHEKVSLLVKLQASADFAKSNTPPWVFFTFLNCKNSTKLIYIRDLGVGNWGISEQITNSYIFSFFVYLYFTPSGVFFEYVLQTF